MEREACVCDHGYERSDLCAEIIIIIIIIIIIRIRPVPNLCFVFNLGYFSPLSNQFNSQVAPVVVQLVTSKPSDVGTRVRILVKSHELGFFPTKTKQKRPTSGERLFR